MRLTQVDVNDETEYPSLPEKGRKGILVSIHFAFRIRIDTSFPRFPPDLRISFPQHRQNGSHFRSQRRSQCDEQRREGWQAPGLDPTFLQGHCQVLDCHAEARYVSSASLLLAKKFGKRVFEVDGIQETRKKGGKIRVDN